MKKLLSARGAWLVALYVVCAPSAFARGNVDRSPIGYFTAGIVILCLLGVLSLSVIESVKKEGFPGGIFKHPVFGAVVGYTLMLLGGAAFLLLLLAVKRWLA